MTFFLSVGVGNSAAYGLERDMESAEWLRHNNQSKTREIEYLKEELAGAAIQLCIIYQIPTGSAVYCGSIWYSNILVHSLGIFCGYQHGSDCDLSNRKLSPKMDAVINRTVIKRLIIASYGLDIVLFACVCIRP